MAWNDDAHIQDCLNRDYDPLDEPDENEALFAAADADLCAGCGHFLPLAPDGYCGQCEPPTDVVVWQKPADSIPWQPSTSSPRIQPRIASIGPGLFVRTGRRRK
jgi:hypothetical protein